MGRMFQNSNLVDDNHFKDGAALAIIGKTNRCTQKYLPVSASEWL